MSRCRREKKFILMNDEAKYYFIECFFKKRTQYIHDNIYETYLIYFYENI